MCRTCRCTRRATRSCCWGVDAALKALARIRNAPPGGRVPRQLAVRLSRDHAKIVRCQKQRARRRVPPRHGTRARGGWPGRICPCDMREERAWAKPGARRRISSRHGARARGAWPGRICPRGMREECAWAKPGARRRVCTAAWGKSARRLTRAHLPPRLSQRAPDELLDCTRSSSARRERARTGRVAQRASGLARGCFIGAKRAASSDESARTRKSGACAMSATGTLPAPLPSPAARGAGRVPLGFARPFPPEPRKGPRAICLLFRDFMLNFEEKF